MKDQVFKVCPRPDCDGQMVYTENEAGCTKGHRFDLYAHGALLEVVGPHGKRGAVQYVDPGEFMTVIDRGARLWNALVNWSSRPEKFQGNLLDLAIDLRDEAKADGQYEKTQMDHEVERMKAAGWRSWEGKQ